MMTLALASLVTVVCIVVVMFLACFYIAGKGLRDHGDD